MCNKSARKFITTNEIRFFLMDKLVPIVKLSKRDIELYQENPLEFIKERDMSSYWKVEESIMMPKK